MLAAGRFEHAVHDKVVVLRAADPIGGADPRRVAAAAIELLPLLLASRRSSLLRLRALDVIVGNGRLRRENKGRDASVAALAHEDLEGDLPAPASLLDARSHPLPMLVEILLVLARAVLLAVLPAADRRRSRLGHAADESAPMP
jgi:hypothetical protein